MRGAAVGRLMATHRENRPLPSYRPTSRTEAAETRSPREPGTSWLRHAASVVGPPLVVAGLVIGVWYFATYVLLDAQRRFLLPPPHAVVGRGSSTARPCTRSSTRPARRRASRSSGCDRVRARHRDRRRDVAGALGRALAVPLGGRPADRPDPGHRAADRLLVGLRLPQPRAGLRADLAVPDDHEHAVRAASAPAGLHDLFSLRRASRWTRLRKLEFPAALPAIFVGLRTSAGPLGDRRDRRRLLLPPGRPGHRPPDRQLPRRAGSPSSSSRAIIASSLLGIGAFALVGWIGRQGRGQLARDGPAKAVMGSRLRPRAAEREADVNRDGGS